MLFTFVDFCAITICVRSLENILGSIDNHYLPTFCIWVPCGFHIDDRTHYEFWRKIPFT